MASVAPQGQADKLGLTVATTTPCLHEKISEESLAPAAFPPLEEKETKASRPSDASSPATVRANPFDTDIEAMITPIDHVGSRMECTKGGSDCQAWPGREHWKRKAQAAKKKRHNCHCLAGLSKRNRILVKILIIVLIVGIAVGVGFGVSKPLGAGIWRSETQNN
jgi:hypothetical protein